MFGLIYTSVLFISWSLSFISVQPAKVFSFSDERPEGSGATIKTASRKYKEGDFTICLDKYITAINGETNLISSEDFTIIIPISLQSFQLHFKGIYYYAFNVPDIEPYTWGTVCFSYTVGTHTIRLAYRGKNYLEKNDPKLLGRLNIRENFLDSFILGRKSNIGTFIGKLSRFTVWRGARDKKSLEEVSDCSRRPSQSNLGKLQYNWSLFVFVKYKVENN